jgi:hypothetical protein
MTPSSTFGWHYANNLVQIYFNGQSGCVYPVTNLPSLGSEPDHRRIQRNGCGDHHHNRLHPGIDRASVRQRLIKKELRMSRARHGMKPKGKMDDYSGSGKPNVVKEAMEKKHSAAR